MAFNGRRTLILSILLLLAVNAAIADQAIVGPLSFVFSSDTNAAVVVNVTGENLSIGNQTFPNNLSLFTDGKVVTIKAIDDEKMLIGTAPFAAGEKTLLMGDDITLENAIYAPKAIGWLFSFDENPVSITADAVFLDCGCNTTD